MEFHWKIGQKCSHDHGRVNDDEKHFINIFIIFLFHMECCVCRVGNFGLL